MTKFREAVRLCRRRVDRARRRARDRAHLEALLYRRSRQDSAFREALARLASRCLAARAYRRNATLED